MWAMTSFGILMPAIRPPKTLKSGDTRTLQIRARRAKDLDILRAKYMPGTLGETIFTPDMDYEYRAYCEPPAFAMAMARMIVEEVDYQKFKPTTEDRYGDKELHDAYNAIWGVVSTRFSTKWHQDSYWKKYGDGSSTSGNSGIGSYTGTGYYSGSRSASGPVGTEYTSGKASAANPAPYEMAQLPSGTDDWDYRDDAPEPSDDPYWLARDVERVLAEHDRRSTAADDLSAEHLTDEEAANLAAIETAAYKRHLTAEEIAAALGEQAPPAQMDHSLCAHSNSAGANARCRRREVRRYEERCRQIQKLVDESRADAARDGAFAQ
jgi:hypothetical protein